MIGNPSESLQWPSQRFHAELAQSLPSARVPWAASSPQLLSEVGCGALRDPHLGKSCFLKSGPQRAQALALHARQCFLITLGTVCSVCASLGLCFQMSETRSHLHSATYGRLGIFAGCMDGWMNGRKEGQVDICQTLRLPSLSAWL